MSEESEFDMWVCACAASNCFIYRLEQVGDCVLYVSRVQEKDRFGNFKHSPRYNAFKAGNVLFATQTMWLHMRFGNGRRGSRKMI